MTYLGSIDATRSKDLDDAMLDSCRHWHLTSYFLLTKLRTFWPHWLRKCRKAGVTTSLNTNGDPRKRWDGVTELLPYIDVSLSREAEALSLTGESDTWGAAKRLASCGPLTIVKCGERGAIAQKGNKRWEIASADVRQTLAFTTRIILVAVSTSHWKKVGHVVWPYIPGLMLIK
jgi:sugar/nucleoside kinase (ribokinase family)